MDMTDRTRRSNLTINLTAGVLAMSLAGYAAAANDYDRIRKDINVMVGIVKSAFEHTDECERCSVRIKGHYLAEQGIVFDVAPDNMTKFYAFSGDEDFEIYTNGMMASIPGMVGDILADVQISLDNADFTYAVGEEWSDLGDRIREKLHDARLELRELERERRELKLESIHADDEQMREIEEQEQALASQIEEITSREKELTEEVSEKLAKRKAEKQARLAEIRARKQARFEQIEAIVLNTFCDYSRTMRSLPKGERVSIIMKETEDRSKIYVLERDDMDNCDSQKTDLRRDALSYAF